MHDPSVVVSLVCTPLWCAYLTGEFIVCTPLWCAYLTGEFLCARCA